MARSAVLLALAGISALRGQTGRAAFFVAMACGLAAVAAFLPGLDHRLNRAVARVGLAVGHAVTFLGAGLVEVFVALPARGIAALRRRDPLTGRRGGRAGWRPVAASGVWPSKGYQLDVPGRPQTAVQRRSPRVLSVLGTVAMVVALDLVIGTAVLAVAGGPAEEVRTVKTPVEVLPGRQLIAPPALAGAPAMDQPWARPYARDLDRVGYSYDPYLVLVARDLSSRYLNISGGLRVTPAVPASTGDQVRDVWVFGGSPTFGYGQRDGHTIASELQRLGAAEGTPLRVTNFGQPGYTAFQDALQLERALADRPTPDLVVLLDGASDVLVQSVYPSGLPTTFPQELETDTAAARGPSVVDRWRRMSALSRLTWRLTGRPPAARRANPQRANPPPADWRMEPLGSRHLADGYARGVHVARTLAKIHHVPFVAFFEPSRYSARSATGRTFRRELPTGVVDLSRLLEREPATYIDDLHADEDGARAVADAVFQQLRAGGMLPRGGR